MIVHPEWLEVIGERKGYFDIGTSGDQHLIDIFGLVKANRDERVIVDNAGHDEYLAVTRIEGPAWYFVTVYPKKLLSTLAFDTAKIILSLGFLSLWIYAMVLFLALRKHVMFPLQELVGATDLLAGGKLDIHLDSSKNDELGRLADSFNRMAAAVKKGIEELRGEVEEHKRLEEAVRVSEERYRSMFENLGAATIILEEDMTVSMANAEFEKLTGYSKKEIEWKVKWPEFIAEEDYERMTGYHFERRREKGKAPGEYECRLVDSEGKIKDIFLKVGMLTGEKMRPFLSVAEQAGTQLAKALVDAGADIISVEDMTASPELIMPQTYSDYELEYQKKQFEAISVPKILHICGNVDKIIEWMGQTGADIMSLEPKADARLAPEKCGPDMILMGGVHTATTLFMGDEEDVRQGCEESISQGIQILAPGCAVAPGTPFRNLEVMVEVAGSH